MRVIGAIVVLFVVIGLTLLYQPWFDPFRLIGFELGSGSVLINAPETAKINEEIKVGMVVGVTSVRSVTGRYKNPVLHYRLDQGDFQSLKPIGHNPLNSKQEEFIFVIPPQSEAGTIEISFEYVFDNDHRKLR
jgi:hypothetical protein